MISIHVKTITPTQTKNAKHEYNLCSHSNSTAKWCPTRTATWWKVLSHKFQLQIKCISLLKQIEKCMLGIQIINVWTMICCNTGAVCPFFLNWFIFLFFFFFHVYFSRKGKRIILQILNSLPQIMQLKDLSSNLVVSFFSLSSLESCQTLTWYYNEFSPTCPPEITLPQGTSIPAKMTICKYLSCLRTNSTKSV